MKKTLKKLNLNKTTISSLNAQQLNQVEGGTGITSCWDSCWCTIVWDLGGGTMDTCGNTCTCPMPTTPTNTIQVPQTV